LTSRRTASSATSRFERDQGYPDGMTVDAEGCLWFAFWDGGRLRQLSPEGAVLAELPLPVERPTSCTFGGPDLDRLFIISARVRLNTAALEAQPLAGALFVVDVGVRGIAARPFAG
jgi:D-xylonolactonase